MKSSQPTEARGDIPRADLQMTSNASGPPFPEGIDRSLRAFRARMRREKLWEAAALCGLAGAGSFLAAAGVDRLFDTPSLLRAALLGLACGCVATVLPLTLSRWVLRHRTVGSIAREVASRDPRTGDRLLGILDRLLLADPEAPPSDSLGLYAPDERAQLVSFCLQPRLTHFGRLLAPGRVDHLLALHDASMLDAGYLSPLGDAEETHLPLRRLTRLCTRLGGHGQRATAPAPSAGDAPRPAAHCDAAWYGSWAAVWRSLRGWLPTLRERSLVLGDAQLEFRSSLALAFGRVSATLDAVRGHAHVDMLPTGFHLPVIHTALVDGRSPAAPPSGGDDDDDDDEETHPSMLYDLDTLDSTTHPHASRAISAIVDAHEFLDLYQHADPVGRARLLDGSTPRGPSSWLRRVPRAPAYSDGRGIFEFHHPTDYPIALATDLQVRPPGSDFCRTCASATGDSLRSIGPDGRHWISCPHGLRLQRSVHHPVRDTLAWLLTAVLGERMVIRETPDGGGRMGSFMRRFPRLGHQPDIVLEGFDGRDSYTILEVKTCEPAGDAYIARQHTDTSRGAAHRYLEQTLAPSQYTVPAHQPGAPRLRLLTFAVSVRGALGSEAQTFIRQLSARVAGAVPYRLLDEASWATQGCAPLLRSAITFSARRALAAGIRRSTCSGAEAAYVVRGCDDQPAPDPARCFDCPADPAPAEPLSLCACVTSRGIRVV